MTTRSKHAHWLDWGRFLAALIVCAGHLRNVIWLDWGGMAPESHNLGTFALFALGRLGHEAVVFFFVLSGYFVGGRCVQALRNGAFSTSQYVVERTARIYPPYLAAIALTVIVVSTTPGAESYSSLTLWGQVLCLQGVWVPVLPGNSPMWSLAYEVWFYVLAGAICTICTRRTVLTRSIAGLCLAMAVWWIFRAMPVYFACWCLGAWSYAASRRLQQGWTAIAGAVIAVTGIVALQLGRESASVPFAHFLHHLPISIPIVIYSAGIALLLPWLSTAAPAGSRLQRLEALGRSFAAFSYSLYLIHQPIIDRLLHNTPRSATIDMTSLGLFLGLLGVLLISAWAFAAVFERLTPKIRASLTPLCHAAPARS